MSLAVSFQLLKSFGAKNSEYSKGDLAALAEFVLASEKAKESVELPLEFTHPKRIQALNRRFRGVDRNTDVIAFRYGQKAFWEGDIAINVDQARIQAKKMGHSTRREIRVLWIHGIL